MDIKIKNNPFLRYFRDKVKNKDELQFSAVCFAALSKCLKFAERERRKDCLGFFLHCVRPGLALSSIAFIFSG